MTIIRSCIIVVCMKYLVDDMATFIKVNGWYPDFKIFCTTIPSVKSFTRKCYLYLIHKKKWDLFCHLNNLGLESIVETKNICMENCYK